MKDSANKAWETKKNNPKKLKDDNRKIGLTRTLRGVAVGTKGPSYKKLDYIFLLFSYFNIITYEDMFKKYLNEVDEFIAYGSFYRFFKILNFPSNRSKHKNKKEIYLKFVEENKHKINWYLENYKRLEDEYFNKKHYEKYKDLFDKNITNKQATKDVFIY